MKKTNFLYLVAIQAIISGLFFILLAEYEPCQKCS